MILQGEFDYTAYADSTVVCWETTNDDLTAQWQLEWDTAGFELGTGTQVNGTYLDDGNCVTITGLNPDLNYEFYVTDICGPGEFSVPGGPATFTGPPPANDLCSDAITLECGDMVMGNITAAQDSAPLIQTCNTWTYLQGPSVWYTFEGTGAEVQLNTCGSTFYNQIFVYTGDCADSLYCEAYSTSDWYQGENQCESSDFFGNFLSIQTEENVTYYVGITGSGSNVGVFNLGMECVPCSDPWDLDLNSTSDTQSEFIWESFNMGGTYYYEYGAPGFVPGDGSGTSGSGDITDLTQTTMITGLTANTSYDIYLWEECDNGFGTDTLMFNWMTNEFAPPVNDLCTGAIVLNCGDTDTTSTLNATSFGNPLGGLCGSDFNYMEGNTIWYSFTGTGEEVNVSTCGSNFTTDLFIMTGSCDSLECVVQSAYDQGPCPTWGATQVSFYAEPGQVYYFSVSPTSTFSAGGDAVVTVECIPCSAPTNISTTVTDVTAWLTWESFNQNADFTVSWDTAGYDVTSDTANVIEGNNGTDLPVFLDGLEPGGVYYVYIWEYCSDEMTNSDTVFYQFTTNLLPPPANDNSCNAIALTAGDTLETTCIYATTQPGEPMPEAGSCNDPDQMLWCISSLSNSTWYTFTPDVDGFATITTCHAGSFDTQMAVYEVEDCSDFSTYNLMLANDDNGNCSVATSFTSTVSGCMEGGVTYYIQIDPYSSFGNGADFSISVDFVGAEITNELEFVTPHTATIQFDYSADDMSDSDFEIILTNQTTMEDTIIYGNTADLPILIEGLDDDTEYSYLVIADDMCGTQGTETLFMTPPDGISELSFDRNITVYPNPVSDVLTIDIKATVNAGSVISLISLQGQVIFTETITDNVTNYRTEIDVDNFARGIYLLKLEDEHNSIQKRVVVQ